MPNVRGNLKIKKYTKPTKYLKINNHIKKVNLMAGIFSLIFLASLVLLIIGFFKPQTSLF